MATYRYLIGDLLTNAVYLEISLFGVSFSRRLNKPGNATFSVALGTNVYNDQDIIDNTIPGKSTFWIERDGAIIWGGIIWSRTYQAQANVLSFTAQTFESFFYRQFVEVQIIKTDIDQRQILVDLIDHMQAKTGADLSIDTALSFDLLDAIVRSVEFNPYQAWSYGRTIEYMINYSDGFDYTIEVDYDVDGNPTKTLSTDNVLGVSRTATQSAFDYPGNIKNYYYPESASEAAVSVLGFGSGEGGGTLISKYSHTDLLAAGYPDLQQSFNNRDVSIQETLDSQTEAEANKVKLPIVVPVLEVNPGMLPTFGDYRLGDYAQVHVQDVRFPNGFSFYSRIVGWDAKPTTSESQEELKLVVAGEEE